MLHVQKGCQARMLFRGDTTIISPSSPGSLSGLQGCNFEMDFTAANSKMAQFVFSISASSPITIEICIRASVTGCIKYAAGLNAQNEELQNFRTAVNVGLARWGCEQSYWRVSAPPDTGLLFLLCLPQRQEERMYMPPYLFQGTRGYPSSKEHPRW